MSRLAYHTSHNIQPNSALTMRISMHAARRSAHTHTMALYKCMCMCMCVCVLWIHSGPRTSNGGIALLMLLDSIAQQGEKPFFRRHRHADQFEERCPRRYRCSKDLGQQSTDHVSDMLVLPMPRPALSSELRGTSRTVLQQNH